MANPNDFVSDEQFIPDGVAQEPTATQDFIPDSQFVSDEDKYGTVGEQAKAGLEGLGRGLVGPAATWLEVATGSKPEDIRGRQEANPVTSGIGEVAGFVAPALLTGGAAAAARAGVGGAGKVASALSTASKYTQAGLLGTAGEAVASAAGIGRASRLANAGTEAISQAFQGILMQGGEELHKSFTQDPSQTSDNVAIHMGMSAILPGLFGGALGHAFGKAETKVADQAGEFISQLDHPAIDAGDLAANIKASELKPGLKEKVLNAINLGKQKGNASEIKAAAKALDDAPLLPGMTLESPLVQTQLDSLINSRYTVAGDRVGAKFDEAYNHAANVLDSTISSGSTASKAELGGTLKDSLTSQIREEYAPIKAVYDELAETHAIIPVEEDTAVGLRGELGQIPEFRVSPSSPQGQLVRQVLKDIDNVKTLSDLKILKDGLSLPATASSQERRMVGILRDKLGDIEENAVERFAKEFPAGDEAGSYVKSLISKKKEVTPQYRQFISKVGELSEQLGKGKIHGVEDALRFLNERLTPEQVASRVFSKNDSQFLDFFSKNFPEQFQTVRNYQRADMIEKATRGDQGFSPKAFFTNYNKLEPEIQAKLYSAPERAKIQAAETYIREAFPKNFNPSGTAHMMALREAHASPKGFAYANVRDYAIEKAIQAAANSGEGRQAVQLAQATVKGENTVSRAINSVFNVAKAMPSNVIPMAASRARLDRAVTKAIQDPSRLVSMNDNNNSVPQYNAPLAASATRVVNYLATVKPNTTPVSPFDSERKPSSYEKAAYDRALDLAEQPLSILAGLKEGRISPTDVQAVRSMYPNVYNKLVSKITEQIVNTKDKGNSIPYKTRIGLSIFLGQPLDSTMTPAAIISAQPAPSQGAPQAPQSQGMATGIQSKGLQKLPGSYQTPEQARAARNQRSN